MNSCIHKGILPFRAIWCGFGLMEEYGGAMEQKLRLSDGVI